MTSQELAKKILNIVVESKSKGDDEGIAELASILDLVKQFCNEK